MTTTTTTVTMASIAAVGLAVTSHDNTVLNTSTFDTVSVTAAPPAPPSNNIVIDASDVPEDSPTRRTRARRACTVS